MVMNRECHNGRLHSAKIMEGHLVRGTIYRLVEGNHLKSWKYPNTEKKMREKLPLQGQREGGEGSIIIPEKAVIVKSCDCGGSLVCLWFQ